MEVSSTSRISSTLRAAWNVVRLDAIRDAVEQTICELQALEMDMKGGRLRRADPIRPLAPSATQRDAARAALEACCEELREGCGLAPVPRAEATQSGDAGWRQAYETAYRVYQDAASDVLAASLGRIPQPRGRS